jgi:signal transduction histidine kinase
VLALRAPALRPANIEVVRRHEDRLPRVRAIRCSFSRRCQHRAQRRAGDRRAGAASKRRRPCANDGAPHVVVQIRDTGPGIPPSAMPHLFEPFYTTKEVGKGTGLGLAITYGIIQEHGGQIVASNHPDGGAVFTVRLPVENG